MAEKLSVTVEAEFPMRGEIALFYDRCTQYARQLRQLLGRGVSVYFFSERMISPMASFNYQGTSIGQISFKDGKPVIQATQNGSWNGRLIDASPHNVWERLFLPYLVDYVEKEHGRLKKLEAAVQVSKLPKLAKED